MTPCPWGALVTTHKIDMYNAAKDMFDYLDPYAQRFGELSSISKLDGQLRAHAKDPISSRPGPGRLRARGPLA